MKKTELIKLKKQLKQEIDRRARINDLLSNDLIQEFISLNSLTMNELQTEDIWPILSEILKDFKITESNGILVCTASFIGRCSICYEETEYYHKKVAFDYPRIEYQTFEDIETMKKYTALHRWIY